jgi:hypothetical protein
VAETVANTPYRIHGVYAASGGGVAQYRGVNRQNTAGAFNILVDSTASFEIRADSSYKDRNAETQAKTQEGRAVINFVISGPDDPAPDLPGITPDDGNDIQVAEGADINKLKSNDSGSSSDITIPPSMIAGIELMPVVGDYGRSGAIYFGRPSPSPAPQLSPAAAPSAGPETLAYGFDVDENLFTHFTLPFSLLDGDTQLALTVESQQYPYAVGDTFDFTTISPGGVEQFFLLDDDGGVAFDESNPFPFVTGLRFANDGIADILIVPFVAVPEPSAALLGLSIVLSLGSLRSRGRR